MSALKPASEMSDINTDDMDDIELELLDGEGGEPKDPDEGKEVKAGKPDDESNDDADDEIKQYSANVQKRIKKLTYDAHEARRGRESSDREREEAVNYAKRMYEENAQLRKTLAQGEDVLVTQAKSRVSAELETAKKAYKEAYDAGDTDALLEAQTKLTELQNESFRVGQYKPKAREQSEFQEPKSQQPPQRTVPKPDARATAWAQENEWFEKDQRMTGFAYGVHQELISEGVDPRTEEYYTKVDEAMRASFPDKFSVASKEDAPQRKSGSVVAPPTRSAKSSRKVQLTPSQVAVAKRIGVPLEEYAKQILKDQI